VPISMDREILEAAGRRYTYHHVMTAADFRGDTVTFRRDLVTSLAVRAYADEQGFEVDPAEIEAAADEFRAEHGLFAGEDLERWLGHCGLILEDVEQFYAGRLLADRFARQARAIRRDYAPSDAEVQDHLWAEAILTGALEGLAVPLARRIAAAVGGRTVSTPDDVKTARRAAKKRTRNSAFDPEWLAELIELEATYAAAEREVLAPEHCEREIRVASLPLSRVAFASVLFPSLDEAREAYLCVSREGEPLEVVAKRAGREIDVQTAFYDELPDDVRNLLFSARDGQVFPPEERDGVFALRQTVRRIDPDANDPDVLARLQHRLLDAHFVALVSRHVRWLFDPWDRA
jgi:hypothetical protein